MEGSPAPSKPGSQDSQAKDVESNSKDVSAIWQDAMYLGAELPEEVGELLQFTGLFHRGKGRLPLFLATVRGLGPHGRSFHWIARRQRKRVQQPHECPTPAAPISWLGWLDVRRFVHKLGWWIALFYIIGSLLFVISGVAGEIQSVAVLPSPPPGLRSLFAGLIGWPDVIAANLFFFPAGILQLIETQRCSSGMDLGCRMRAWEKGGRVGPRPTRTALPCMEDLRSIAWWASVIQLSGMLGFNMATLFSLLSAAIVLQPDTLQWTTNFGFTFGGVAFTVSSVLFAYEATGSWWRGLVPSRLSDLRSISWNAVFWSFHGSVGFLIGGAATYAEGFSWMQMQFLSGYGDLMGAVWFLLSALCALLEQANPRHP